MNNINYEKLYNDAYKKFTPEWVNPNNIAKIDQAISLENSTLLDFYSQYVEQFDLNFNLHEMNFLETGCGLGSFALALGPKFNSTTAIDISALATAMGSEIAILKEVDINFIKADLTKKIDLGRKFDFILDSHLLHCLVTKEQRLNYYNFLAEHLSENGHILVETMVFHKDLQIPIGYEFSEDLVLYQEIEGEYTPVRYIGKSIDIENELKNTPLKIKYLYYHNELSFEVFEGYENYPHEYLPKTLRMSLMLK